MTNPQNNKYFKEASAMRQRLLKEEVEPFIKDVFKYELSYNSILMFIGQYWNDNASDECHKTFLFTTDVEPFVDEDNLHRICEHIWSINNLGYVQRLYNNNNLKDAYTYENDWYTDSIPAFSSYCKSFGSQDHGNIIDSYSLYAVYKRANNDEGFICDIVGIQHRPELEGIASEWELTKDRHNYDN